jgi:hypothetical protein
MRGKRKTQGNFSIVRWVTYDEGLLVGREVGRLVGWYVGFGDGFCVGE